MRDIKTITGEEINYLQNNKQCFICYLSEEELATHLDINALNTWFDEFPLALLNTKEELKITLANMETSTVKGKLEWIRIKTHLNGGKILFRRLNTGQCQILVIFSEHPHSQELNPMTPAIKFDGVNGLRFLHLIQLFCPTEMLTLTPSIHIKITVDGVIETQQSVITLVDMYQAQAKVGVLNKVYHGFKTLEAKLIYADDEIQNTMYLQYR